MSERASHRGAGEETDGLVKHFHGLLIVDPRRRIDTPERARADDRVGGRVHAQPELQGDAGFVRDYAIKASSGTETVILSVDDSKLCEKPQPKRGECRLTAVARRAECDSVLRGDAAAAHREDPIG
jgi:hypothetical protein